MMKASMQSAKGRQIRVQGFTLIELMVVIAIIGILASIAWPNYQDYLIKSRRAGAQSDMLKIQLGLEKWRANNNSYASTLDHTDAVDTPADLADTLSTANTYYNYAITGAVASDPATASSYVIRATAQGGQTADTGCTSLTLNQSNTRGPSGCWKS